MVDAFVAGIDDILGITQRRRRQTAALAVANSTFRSECTCNTLWYGTGPKPACPLHPQRTRWQYWVKPLGCTCPDAWWGILPPPCPIHNPPPDPARWVSVTTTTTNTTRKPAPAKPAGDAMRAEDC